jgi:type VI protein secretion system component Hcp
VLEDRTLLTGTPTATLQLLPAPGQSTPAAVTLLLNSFQLGFHRQIGPNSVASFDELDVRVPYTANSPLLFGQLTKGPAYPSAVLTQRDAGGNTVGIWALNDVHLTDDAITGSGNGLPAEELKFAFGAVAQSVGHNIQGWSQVLNSSDSSDIPSVPDPAPPAVAPTRMTLDLASGNATPVSLDLNTFQFGFHNSTTVGPTGVVSGTTSFDELDVTAALSDAGPNLFAAVTTGHNYRSGTVTQYDAAGNPAAVWVINPAIVTDFTITGRAGALPTQDVKLLFGAVTEATSNDSASWTHSTASATGPAVPAGLTLDALPSPAATGLTLKLYTSTAPNAAPAATLNLNTFQLGFHHGTGTNSVTSFDELDVTAALSSNSPALLAALTAGSQYALARLTQSDATGKTMAVWALGTVYVTDDAITGTGSGLPGEELKFAFEGLGQGVGHNQQSWNQVTNSSPDFGNLDPGVPAVAPTRMTLELISSNAIAVSLELNSFQFGFHDPVTFSSTGNTLKGTSFDELDVTAALSDAAPVLFGALTTGHSYDSGMLTQYDAAGNPAAVWVFGPDQVTDDILTGSGGQTTQELKFAFGSVTEATSNNSRSWTLANHSASGPAVPAGLAFDALPSQAAPHLTLQLYTSTASNATPFTIDLNSFQLGFHRRTGPGTTSFDALDVTAALSGNSPALFAALTAGSQYALARLTQSDGQGNSTGVFALGTVYVTDDAITGTGSGLPDEELKFAFVELGQGVGPNQQEWNQVTNTPPTDLGFLDPAVPAVAPTRMTLDLAGGERSSSEPRAEQLPVRLPRPRHPQFHRRHAGGHLVRRAGRDRRPERLRPRAVRRPDQPPELGHRDPDAVRRRRQSRRRLGAGPGVHHRRRPRRHRPEHPGAEVHFHADDRGHEPEPGLLEGRWPGRNRAPGPRPLNPGPAGGLFADPRGQRRAVHLRRHGPSGRRHGNGCGW